MFSGTAGTAVGGSTVLGSPKMGLEDCSDAASAPRLNGSEELDSGLEKDWLSSGEKIDGVLTNYRVIHLSSSNNQYKP